MMNLDKNYKIISVGLREHYEDAVKEGYEPLVLALQGSQNYDLAYECSDIDTKCLVMPKFKDIVFNRRPISFTKIRENDEHIDIKDIRVYFEQFWKQNINFLEILFTPYVIINRHFSPYWKELTLLREDIAHFNMNGAIKSMAGMAMEKFKALEHPYPTIAWKIEKWGYDGKQLHHILRLEEFLRGYIGGKSFAECLITYPKYGREMLMSAKSNKYSLDQARVLANVSMYEIQQMKDSFETTQAMEINNEIKSKVNEILYAIFEDYIKKELEVKKK